MDRNKVVSKTLGLLLGAGLVLSLGNQAFCEAYDEDQYGPEAPLVWETPAKADFSHKVHTMDAGLECDSCHDDVFAMENGAAEAAGDFTMKAMAEGKYCGTCHDDGTAFSTNSECASCHREPTKDEIVFTKPVKAVIFGHKLHTEMGFDCSSCHSGLFEMRIGAAEEDEANFVMDTLYKGQSCGSCHNGETAFASNKRCTVCHIGVKGFDRMFGTPDKGHGGGH